MVGLFLARLQIPQRLDLLSEGCELRAGQVLSVARCEADKSRVVRLSSILQELPGWMCLEWVASSRKSGWLSSLLLAEDAALETPWARWWLRDEMLRDPTRAMELWPLFLGKR